MWWIIAVYVVGLIIISAIITAAEKTIMEKNRVIDFILITLWPITLTACIIFIVAKALYLCYDAIVCGIEDEINTLG